MLPENTFYPTLIKTLTTNNCKYTSGTQFPDQLLVSCLRQQDQQEDPET